MTSASITATAFQHEPGLTAFDVNPSVRRALAKPGVRIALLGNFGSFNLGNEGSLESLLTVLRDRRPDAHISCICPDPRRASALHDLPAIPIRDTRLAAPRLQQLNGLLRKWPGRFADLLRTMSRIRRYDVLIVPGTGILDDFGEKPLAMPYTLLAWSIAARVMRRPLCLVSIGAGPIVDPLSRRFMRAAARLARYRSYRDVISRDFAGSIGLPVEHDTVTPDLVFAMPTPRGRDAGAPRDVPFTVGLGVMAYDGWDPTEAGAATIYDRYIGKLTDFAGWLLARGIRVRLLVGETCDQRAVDDVSRRLRHGLPCEAAQLLVAEPANTLRTLMTQMLDTDCVVATRFHNVVCALKVARPVISLGYARKNDVLLADFGLADFCQHIETFDVAVLKRQFEALISELTLHRDRIDGRTDRYRQLLDAQVDALFGEP